MQFLYYDTTIIIVHANTVEGVQRVIIFCKAWLAQSVEHQTLNLRVVGSSPTLGVHFVYLCNFCAMTL